MQVGALLRAIPMTRERYFFTLVMELEKWGSEDLRSSVAFFRR